jgi:dUTP pyrophosphatase
MIVVKYTIDNEDLVPFYAKKGDAGMDIKSSKELAIRRGQTVIVPTGLKMEVPIGYMIQIVPRSGISLNTPLRVSNSPGTIDSGYRDEIGIIITNTSIHSDKIYYLDSKGNQQGTYVIKIGDRIAQIILIKCYDMKLVSCKLNMENNRGGGFGSTGTF